MNNEYFLYSLQSSFVKSANPTHKLKTWFFLAEAVVFDVIEREFSRNSIPVTKLHNQHITLTTLEFLQNKNITLQYFNNVFLKFSNSFLLSCYLNKMILYNNFQTPSTKRNNLRLQNTIFNYLSKMKKLSNHLPKIFRQFVD